MNGRTDYDDSRGAPHPRSMEVSRVVSSWLIFPVTATP